MKKELSIFFTAIMFFTRIPCPKWINCSSESLQKCTKYFSLIGIIVGGFGALIYWSASYILPQNIAIILSVISTIWITGAFHEDGFADVCDGFGGGYTKEKILLIMKDSLVGTYGIVGLICLLTLKFTSLSQINSQLIITLIAGHSVSRCITTFILYLYPYARIDESSKSKDVAGGFKPTNLILNVIIGLIPLFFYDTYWVFLALIPPFIAMLLLGRFFNKWIGGQTGDCAGATQQITEVVFYLSLLVLWKFI
ncbi:adenosylcobinamide-GDP ribazoletransferase [Lutibacter sp. HS1-25]|uniref:adenosylcobinamide-GDP ribazoletransferase n=1 Tax=Lutibacter sp. HS1-25 TaxID=2485000 RepID=UPI0010132DA7|nr:adenosylcobinamide-GDP ribazoletransferase [Lutibacter sp. HS1-25]RXP44810.1 adenosylcobinamide-GDP ribazoletransferase [Lutibacter sp. HS1-25]